MMLLLAYAHLKPTRIGTGVEMKRNDFNWQPRASFQNKKQKEMARPLDHM